MTESAPPQAPNYKDTLNLPKTSFDMKANLVQREPAMLAGWQKENLYGKIREARKGSEKGKWVLHDGPPYANGDIHMGHLINKVLKDIVVKFRTMQGYDSPYVPGWDCHGLPIESAIQKELGPKFRELTKDDVRKKCHEYAMKWVKVQGDGFQRLGILGSFDRPYLTLDKQYEGGIMDVLAELVQRELVYRQKKPVHWCTNDRTALAEAELEYADRKDHSIYVEFLCLPHPSGNSGQWPAAWADEPPQSFMIWTSTPWTLPANQGIAVNPEFEYVTVNYSRDGHQRVTVIAKDRVKAVMDAGKVTDYKVGPSVLGRELLRLGTFYVAPVPRLWDGVELVGKNHHGIGLAEYVTLSDGTGLVHTAPGHGKEDYITGMRYANMEVYCPVLSDGRYDTTVQPFLQGKTIWEANDLVIAHLHSAGTLFHHETFGHSYPHCWRCKKPIIFRATEQWFVRASGEVDTDSPINYSKTSARNTELWNRAKKFIDDVKWVPAWGKNRIDSMLDTRPDWCISRQRSWGVPIPAFFDSKGRCLLTEASIRQVATYFRTHGADAWYTHEPAKILGLDLTSSSPGLLTLGFPADVDVTTLEKGQDILDVWFESGASHHAVLECTHPELGYPANMYLEGSDQHRGWFQSSLLEASGYKSEPPFKEVLTHGFIVDGNGRKMSKSEGNDIKVADALKESGADVLRLWVSSVDYQNDIPLSKELLKTIGESYRKIRNTIRYLLGNLYDFDPQTHMTGRAISIDTWMTQRLNDVKTECYRAYDSYEFHKVFRTIYEFCNIDVSATYAKAIKDRLYCELPDAQKRRSSQSVCYWILKELVELLAPILVYTAEEAWAAMKMLPGNASLSASVHLSQIDPPIVVDRTMSRHWDLLLPMIDKGNKQLDELKKSAGLGNPLDAEVVIIVPKIADDVTPHIEKYGPEIEDALGVGFHRIEHGEIWDIKIHDTRERYPSCARSWKRRPDVGSVEGYPDLSKRDAEVVKTLRAKA